ncbi:hypothetical protein [Neptuniibacter marinus]|uniref:hypothetical protein n=1 Tax=Neptuniibacter marinus TaxID=1806670 RepID=UPI0008365908|nr:hypothetical protein [Neptuniibacter marinus]
MLGTRIILMGMDKHPNMSTQSTNAEMLCAANYTIPLFWLLLFSETELESFSVADDSVVAGEESAKYPILIADSSAVVARLNERYNHLIPFLNVNDADLLQRWLSFITKQNHPVFAIDTYELWCSKDDPSSLYDEIAALLKELDTLTTDTDTKQQLQMLVSSGQWSLGNGIALAGFGW